MGQEGCEDAGFALAHPLLSSLTSPKFKTPFLGSAQARLPLSCPPRSLLLQTKPGTVPKGSAVPVPSRPAASRRGKHWLTTGTNHSPDQVQGAYAHGLLAYLHLAEEELHQLLGVGLSCRNKDPSVMAPVPWGTAQAAVPLTSHLAVLGASPWQRLTQGYEAMHDLHQVLAAELMLGRGLGAHLGRGCAGSSVGGQRAQTTLGTAQLQQPS